MRKEFFGIFVMTALILSLTLTSVSITSSNSKPLVSVDPQTNTAGVGETFTINVTVTNVTDLYSWGINLTFDPDVLNVVNVTEGPFLPEFASTVPCLSIFLTGQINNIVGFLTPGGMLYDSTQIPPFPPEGATGSGVLAIITFEVKSVGITLLRFADTKLNTVIGGSNVPIEHVAEGGLFDNSAGNEPPVALFDAEPLSAEVNETITFNASASYDPDAWLVTYKWDFGDGTTETYLKDINLTAITYHAYNQSGTYKVTLTVTDYYGATDTATADILVGHDIAVTSIEMPYTAVMPGVQVPINVTVANERGFSETFNVTSYYGNTTIGIETVNLGPLAEASVTFIWNTTSLPEGDYIIYGVASNVKNESNIGNNMKNRTITLAPFNLVPHSVEVGGFTFYVITESNSRISNFTFIQEDKKIKFNVTGENGTSGFCNITIPIDLLGGNYTVLIDGSSITPEKTTNGTHNFLYFTYTLSTRTVQIIGQTVATSPIALFTYLPETLIVGEEVTFNSASYDPDGNVSSWEWDLNGDGNIDAYTESTTYTYTSTGTYTVTLTVKDDKGLTNSTEVSLKVIEYPNAVFTYFPQNPIVGDTVTFNASASNDTDGWIVSYTWDFGDGNVTPVNNVTKVITHTFATAGTYKVALNVTDNDDLTDTDTQSIIIGEMNSTIHITLSQTSITLGENTTINGFIEPVRSGATVTIWYRLSGEETWSTLKTLTTDENSQYSYVWTPESTGTYEIKAGWEGDENTFADETEVRELTVQEAPPPPGPATPLYLIVAVVAAVIVITIIVVYFVKVRKPT